MPGVIATVHKGAVQAQHWCTAAASARRCSVVAPAASPAHKAQLTTALMAQGWCHESVDIATAQGAVQQLRATVPHRSSVAAAAVSPLQRRRCTKRMWTTGLHSWHKLTGVRIHCHCTRCCAAPEGYLSTAMFATSTGVQLSCNRNETAPFPTRSGTDAFLPFHEGGFEVDETSPPPLQ